MESPQQENASTDVTFLCIESNEHALQALFDRDRPLVRRLRCLLDRGLQSLDDHYRLPVMFFGAYDVVGFVALRTMGN